MGEQITWPKYKDAESRARWLAAYDAALKDWPVAFEARDVATTLGTTRVTISGPADAPPVILLHSLAATGLSWRANAAALSQARRVYAVDIIGQAGTSPAARQATVESDYVQWLSELMDALAAPRAAFVGCSHGAFLAASLAVAAPERVEKLVLIGPPGVFADMSWRVALRMRLGPLQRRLRRLVGDRRPPNAARLHAGKAPLHAEDNGWRRLMGVTMAESAVLALTPPRVFSRAELARITAPTLLLLGEYEQLYEPVATLRRARRLKPDIAAEIVPGADHIAAMAQPDWVNARVLAFLDRG